MTDLDQGGRGFQRVRTYLGPSLGWTDELVQPSVELKTSGTYKVKAGDSIILVDVAGFVTIQLPDVRLWIQQTGNQPATAFDRSITIKDIGGNAQNFNIVVAPFGQQEIDNVQASVVISQIRSSLKLTPLIDLTGWALTLSGTGSSLPGGGDVFKAGNNTYTGVNTFTNTITAPTVVVADNSTNVATTEYVNNKAYITGAALLPYALIASPTFTGVPKAPTPAPTAEDDVIVTVRFVEDALAAFSGGAPATAEYVVGAINAALPGARLVTNTSSIGWDLSTPGQIKANTLSGGGNVSNSGTPTVGQYAQWVTSTTIKGVDLTLAFAPIDSPTFTGDPKAPTPPPGDNDTSIATTAFVKAGYQPLDGDLTAISALLGTNTIYYRSATDIWSPVAFAGLTFSGGVLSVTGGGGNVNSTGVPLNRQTARWTNSTTIEGHNDYVSAITAPVTPYPGDFWYDTSIGVLSIFIDDGNGTQWVQVAPLGGVAPPTSFPAGTLMLFQQTAAPTGWTKQTAHNDKALRIVSGSATSGGVQPFATLFNRTTVDAMTLDTSQIPSHAHPYNAQSNGSVGGDGSVGGAGADFNPYTLGAGGSQAHTHGMDMRVQFVDAIIASKD